MTIIQPDRLNDEILIRLARIDARVLHDFYMKEHAQGKERMYLTYPAALRLQDRARWWFRYTTREPDPVQATQLRRMVIATLLGWGPAVLADFAREHLGFHMSVASADWHLRWCARSLALWKRGYWTVCGDAEVFV